MKTIDHEAEVPAIRGAYDLVGQVERRHAAIRLAEKLEGERHVMTCRNVAEFRQDAHGFCYNFRAGGTGVRIPRALPR